MESKAETDITFLKGTNPNESHFENLEEGDPVSSLESDIGDYFLIEKEQWEIVWPQYGCAPIYDIDREDKIEIGFSFILNIIYDDISIDTFGKENYYFPLYEEG